MTTQLTPTLVSLTPTIVIHGDPYGVIAARNASGELLASAYDGRDGWAVTNRRGRCMHQICVETYDDAMAVLKVVARGVAS